MSRRSLRRLGSLLDSASTLTQLYSTLTKLLLDEQAEFAQIGEPAYDSTNLLNAINAIKPTCLIGAVGRAPNCFDQPIIEKLVAVNNGKRPVVFALSNPKTQVPTAPLLDGAGCSRHS